MTGVYPDVPVEVVDFDYRSPLHLTRSIQAVQRRAGEDADYVLAEPYESTVTVRPRDGAEAVDLPLAVPAGMLTDLSSVPRWGRWLVGRVGPHLEASIVHDWLYVAWQVEGLEPTDTMRKFADDVFLAAMRKAGVGSVMSWLIHRAVRLGGGGPFKRTDEYIFDETQPGGDAGGSA